MINEKQWNEMQKALVATINEKDVELSALKKDNGYLDEQCEMLMKNCTKKTLRIMIQRKQISTLQKEKEELRIINKIYKTDKDIADKHFEKKDKIISKLQAELKESKGKELYTTLEEDLIGAFKKRKIKVKELQVLEGASKYIIKVNRLKEKKDKFRGPSTNFGG